MPGTGISPEQRYCLVSVGNSLRPARSLRVVCLAKAKLTHKKVGNSHLPGSPIPLKHLPSFLNTVNFQQRAVCMSVCICVHLWITPSFLYSLCDHIPNNSPQTHNNIQSNNLCPSVFICGSLFFSHVLLTFETQTHCILTNNMQSNNLCASVFICG